MPDRKFYGQCKTHCKEETMTKDQILAAIAAGGATCYYKGSYTHSQLGPILYEYNGPNPKNIAVTIAGNILEAAIDLVIDSSGSERVPALGSTAWISTFAAADDCIFKFWIYGKECTVTNCRIVNGSKVKDCLYIFIENDRTLKYTASGSSLDKILYKADLDNSMLGEKHSQGAGTYIISLNKFYKIVDPAGFRVNFYISDSYTDTWLTDLLYSGEIYIKSVTVQKIDSTSGELVDSGFTGVITYKFIIDYIVNGVLKTKLIQNIDQFNSSGSARVTLNSDNGVIYEIFTGSAPLGAISNETLATKVSNLENEVGQLSAALDEINGEAV